MRDGFDNLDGALYVATGVRAARRARWRCVRRSAATARVALAFLAFPPVMIAASSGSNDVVAAALVAAALRARGSTAALAAAGWVKLAPLALVPLWVARYRDRGAAARRGRRR